jgi:hypothetical protein
VSATTRPLVGRVVVAGLDEFDRIAGLDEHAMAGSTATSTMARIGNFWK